MTPPTLTRRGLLAQAGAIGTLTAATPAWADAMANLALSTLR